MVVGRVLRQAEDLGASKIASMETIQNGFGYGRNELVDFVNEVICFSTPRRAKDTFLVRVVIIQLVNLGSIQFIWKLLN